MLRADRGKHGQLATGTRTLALSPKSRHPASCSAAIVCERLTVFVELLFVQDPATAFAACALSQTCTGGLRLLLFLDNDRFLDDPPFDDYGLLDDRGGWRWPWHVHDLLLNNRRRWRCRDFRRRVLCACRKQHRECEHSNMTHP